MQRSEDPRDYKVGFERIASELGFEPAQRVPDGIREIIATLEVRGLRRSVRRSLPQLLTYEEEAIGPTILEWDGWPLPG